MTPTASIGAPQLQPLIQRAGLPRAPQLDDRVYDPVLDPAYQTSAGPEVVVTARKSVNKADDEPFSFWDLLDVINPLQHIPGVNTIYRELTGDEIKTPVKLIGATVLGGPIGFAAAMADSLIGETTGKDLGEHAMAMFKDGAPASTTPTQTQMATTPSMPAARAAAQYAAAQSYVPQAANPAEEFVPDPALGAAASQQKTPSEAEAFVQAAQIAAQANVFPTFKRTGGIGGASPADKAQSQEKLAAVQVANAHGQSRFMPLQRDGGTKPATASARRDGAVNTVSELKARSKFAPGPRGTGSAEMSPVALAAATAAKNEAGEKARLAAAAQTNPPSATDAYNYGRQAASGGKPAEMPVWFDQAMLGAMDKYKAMQAAK